MTGQSIVLSLISHTNIGKTTLSRTLLKADVGEVRDAAHVTEESSRHPLWASGRDQLLIWDTPGFGNVAGLLKRLQQEGGALGWLMHEVVDRMVNRPLYSSLEAVRNVRLEADVVLYLVNAQEDPEDAGYVEAEFQLLDALGKPVIMVINQVTPDGTVSTRELERLWHDTFAHHPCLKATTTLDAFTRSWQQEIKLVNLVRPHLDEDKRTALDRLRAHYVMTQDTIFKTCARSAADTLRFAMAQRVSREEGKDEAVFARLMKELEVRLTGYLQVLVQQHGILAEGRAQLDADIKQVTGLLAEVKSEQRTGLLAGAVAGASSGLVADVLSGGLSLGGGALLGFLGGYLGGFSYAKVLNAFSRGAKAAWKKEALISLYKLLLSYYLLATLHGRGKGSLNVSDVAPFLARAIDAQWDLLEEEVTPLLHESRGDEDVEAWQESFQGCFKEGVTRVLAHIYPDLKADGTLI